MRHLKIHSFRAEAELSLLTMFSENWLWNTWGKHASRFSTFGSIMKREAFPSALFPYPSQ